mgnify:CR=1 FL=1
MAFYLPLVIGIAVLAVTAARVAQRDQSGVGFYFIVGLVSGYLIPLTVRVSRMIGPEKVTANRWLLAAGICLTFVGLLGGVIVAVIAGAKGDALQSAIGGTITMVMLGTAVQEDAPERIAA